MFRETIGYEVALFVLSPCTTLDVPYLHAYCLAALLLVVLLLIYPIRTFLAKIFEVAFMIVNIIAKAYSLKSG
jgi:hypothetical protein